ncbi:MAG: S49 family peptidase [Rhodobacteraceae bacterium]|nr:S49 family peptidase [Paracoccaceae bacterium]
MHTPMIAQRVFNTPLLVDPVKGHAFLSGFGARLVEGRMRLPVTDLDDAPRLERASRTRPRASILGADLSEGYRERGRRMFGLREGIAIIEATGTLVHRGDWLGESSGATSYEGLAQQVEAAAADPAVAGIALEIDTFGGEVAGVFDLADTIRAARAQKPVWAFVAEAALSAGYALASQADRIILPRTGEVGSIGVLIVHADYSQRLSDEGVRVTMIHAGSHKVDGNPYEPLPEDVRDTLQAETEEMRLLFAATIEAGRGARLDAPSAIATQARVFRGARAVELGLADQVMDLRAGFASFKDHIHRRPPAAPTRAATGSAPRKEPAMSGTTRASHRAETATDDPVTGETELDTTNADKTGADASGTEDGSDTVKTPPAAASATTLRQTAEETVGTPRKAANLSRSEAAAIADIGAQAARLGINVDVAAALREGVSADALRTRVLSEASARDEAAGVMVATPAASTKPKESPIVAAAKRAASQVVARH